MLSTVTNSYAWTSPYDTFQLRELYGTYHHDLYSGKLVRERDFSAKIEQTQQLPEILIMGNFTLDRAATLSLARQHGVNTIHGEDGFFPHYGNLHTDPLGFCWESSLCRMVFRRCTDDQRARARESRSSWLQKPVQCIPPDVKKDFVLWPLQLIGDKVNRADLAVESWYRIVSHFRQCLPTEIQLVMKEHPRARPNDMVGLASLVTKLPNTILISGSVSLHALLLSAKAVAGINSTVLHEARLMYKKPVYAYGKSWFTNHDELFMPVRLPDVRILPRVDWLFDSTTMLTERLEEYTDWFLYQLLVRQLDSQRYGHSKSVLKQRMMFMSYRSYLEHGECLFS